MTRIIASPVAKWPGKIHLADPLTYPQYAAWWDALQAATAGKAGLTIGDLAKDPRLVNATLPGLLACVERWELTGFPEVVTAETFPATPRGASVRLLIAVLNAVNEIVTESDAIPNA